MKRPLTRKETAPRNVAAKALREGQFQPKVEANPHAYKRKQKHRQAVALDVDEEAVSPESEADRTEGGRPWVDLAAPLC